MRRVILVHGIREHGEWFGLVTPALEARELKVHTIQFDHTGILTLLIPPLGREARAADVRKKLEQAFEAWPNDEISIIAFSFGTYLVTRAMLERSDLIKPKYLILSGAIASRALDWNRIGAVLKKGEVLNECGIDDPWPVVAESFAVGYGYVGTRGVGHPRVKDRFHKAGHSTIYKSQGRPICEDWAQIIADDKDPSHQFAGRSPKWFGWIKWGVRALMALAVMLLLLVVFQRQAEAYVGGKIWPWETVRAELHREVDLSRSSCIDGARETVQQITETYRFSHPVRRFNIREIVRTDAGRFPHVTTRDGAALPTDFFALPRG
jgi:hypothetical protein